MPTEAEFEATPDATDGRALLEARLKRLSPIELDAFREAVRRCYAGGLNEEPQDSEAH